MSEFRFQIDLGFSEFRLSSFLTISSPCDAALTFLSIAAMRPFTPM